MDEKTAKSLKTQLQAAASQIDSQAGSERAVLSAMQLLADATSKFDFSQMSDLDFQVMLRTQQKTLTSVGQFAQQLQNRPLTEKQEAEIARLKKDVSVTRTGTGKSWLALRLNFNVPNRKKRCLKSL